MWLTPAAASAADDADAANSVKVGEGVVRRRRFCLRAVDWYLTCAGVAVAGDDEHDGVELNHQGEGEGVGDEAEAAGNERRATTGAHSVLVGGRARRQRSEADMAEDRD